MSNESIYKRIHRVLTWKRIIAFNLFMMLILIVPFAVRLAQEDTDYRSEATGEEVEIEEPPADYPSGLPRIERVKMFYGKVGDTVVLLGENFGDYQWDSQVYVGNALANKDDVVRWSNGVIEVRIPEKARTGGVWMVVNGKRASWEGSLYLYDVDSAAEVGLKAISNSRVVMYLGKGDQIRAGIIELAYVNDPINIEGVEPVEVVSTESSSDSLGKKIRVELQINNALPRANTDILTINYAGIGTLEIYRAEMYDEKGNVVEVYSNPLDSAVKL